MSHQSPPKSHQPGQDPSQGSRGGAQVKHPWDTQKDQFAPWPTNPVVPGAPPWEPPPAFTAAAAGMQVWPGSTDSPALPPWPAATGELVAEPDEPDATTFFDANATKPEGLPSPAHYFDPEAAKQDAARQADALRQNSPEPNATNPSLPRPGTPHPGTPTPDATHPGAPPHDAPHPAGLHPGAPQQPDAAHPGGLHPGDSQTDAPRPGDLHPGAPHPDATHPGDIHPGLGHPGNPQSGTAHPSAPHPDATHPGDIRPGIGHPGNSGSGTAHSGGTGTAHPTGPQPDATHPGAPQAATNQPGASQPGGKRPGGGPNSGPQPLAAPVPPPQTAEEGPHYFDPHPSNPSSHPAEPGDIAVWPPIPPTGDKLPDLPFSRETWGHKPTTSLELPQGPGSAFPPGAFKQPPFQTPPPPPAPPGKSKRALLVTLGALALAGVATGGFFAFQAVSNPAPTTAAARATTSAKPTTNPPDTPPPDVSGSSMLNSEQTDPQKLSLSEAFPKKKVSVAGTTFTRVKADMETSCDKAAMGAFADALKAQKCTRVLRATYVDSKRRYAVTTGIAVLPTKDAATTADQAKSLSRNVWFRGLPSAAGSGGERVDIAGGYAAGLVWGRYIVFSYATHSDGHTPDSEEKALPKVSGAFRDQTALVLERRITKD
ncbi:hypothetical protein ACFOY2_26350 [Nonomuraea purpurea]|uniref:Uncharacterized protein n=1 Tax=Nonomuraea purpurea TaxID=1849276 RepID=A0ABV8G9W3_9ACTN